jgi:hypothetical protein
MRRVVQAAIAAAGVDGATRCYFVLNNWELSLRERFAAISRQVTNNDTNVRPRAIGPQKGVSTKRCQKPKTRCSSTNVPEIGS